MKSRLPWSSQDSLDLDKMRLGPSLLDESWKVNDTGESLLGTGNVFIEAGNFSTLFTFSLLLKYFKKLSTCWGHGVESGFQSILNSCTLLSLSAHEVWPGAGGRVMDLRSLLAKVFWTPSPEGKVESLLWTGQRHPALRLSKPTHRSGNSKIWASGRKASPKLQAERRLVTILKCYLISSWLFSLNACILFISFPGFAYLLLFHLLYLTLLLPKLEGELCKQALRLSPSPRVSPAPKTLVSTW